MDRALSRAISFISILVGLSSLLYFSGFLYELGHYFFLEIPIPFSDYQYNELVIAGFFRLFFVLPIILLTLSECFIIIYLDGRIKKVKENLTELFPIISRLNQSQNEEDKKNLEYAFSIERDGKETIEIIERNKEALFAYWDSWSRKFLFLFLCITSIIGSFFGSPVLHNSFLLELFIFESFLTVSQYLLIYLLYKHLKGVIRGDFIKRGESIIIYPIIVLILLISPAFEGAIDWEKSLTVNQNPSIDVYTTDEGSYLGDYIFSDADEYVILVNKKEVFIPVSKIVKVVAQ